MEAAVSWQVRKDVKLNLNLFRHIMRDTIRTVAKSGGIGQQFTNTGQLHGDGTEVEAVWDASRNLRLTANFSWQATIDESTNQDAGYTARKHAFAKADWRLAENWLVCPQLDWVADRRRTQGDTRAQVPDYATFDLAVHKTQEKDKLDFSASVRNLFNATVLEPTVWLATYSPIPNDLPVAPRTIWLQATYKP